MNLNLEKERLYIAGISGGPDSMAMLDILYKEGYSFVVCFVNYHTREASEYEEKMVGEYCSSRGIRCEVLDTSLLKRKGNFEGWARDVRYRFFKEIYDKNNAYALLIAHHKDDNIETYIMQKRRRGIVSYYGIKEESELYGMKVIRPLLSYRKKELNDYCQNNHVPYSIDETNLKDDIIRNKIRHETVEKLTDEECRNYLSLMKEENDKMDIIFLQEKENAAKDFLPCSLIKTKDDKAVEILLYLWINGHVGGMEKKLSYSRIGEIKKMIVSPRPNIVLPLRNDYKIVKEYDAIHIRKEEEKADFFYIIREPCFFECREFCIDLQTDTSFLKIYPSSYPLTVRGAKAYDKVKFENVEKSVRRIFIDEKIPLSRRKRYPVFLDKNGKVVYLPLFRSNKQKDIASKLKFVLK